MKSVSILMPQMGQSMAEGRIVKWHKQVGDFIKADEIVVEVESDKISFEVESPTSGRLKNCLKSEGEAAAVGEVIGFIEAEGAVASSAHKGDAHKPPAHKPHAGSDENQVLVSTVDTSTLDLQSVPEIMRDWYSPYVLRLALTNGVSIQELQAIRGTGTGGRVTKTDLLKYLGRRPIGGATVSTNGRPEAISEEDKALGEVIPMTTIRRTIADHMVQSIRTSAHVTMVHAVDMTQIVALRELVKDRFAQKYGVKITYTAVMIFVTARVLRDFPVINSSVSGTSIILRKDVNIGCAVALQDESLVVPVIKNADKKSFPQVAQELDQLIQLARKKNLGRDDIDQGTFTISNFGAFGSLIGTPIINQPQVAILGMGAVFKAPVVVNNEICVRDQIYLSFSFDHRVIDGAMGGRFLNAIQRTTEALTEKALDIEQLA